MAIIKPFKGLRPKSELANKVASPPYDVLSSEEAREVAKGNKYSFLHISKSEIDLPESTDHYADAVYEKAKENLQKFIADKILVQDEKNYMYIYRQIMPIQLADGTKSIHKQTGLVANSSIQDYFNDVIKKHEYTRPEKENDRIKHMAILECHPEPVFLTYPDVKDVDEIISEVTVHAKPEYDFVANDEIQHTFWVIKEEEKIKSLIHIFETKIPFTYIADGHHRSASSAKVGKQLAEKNPEHTGNEEYNFFLSVLFPSSQLMIMDYNRLIKDINNLSPEEFFRELDKKFIIQHQGKSAYKPKKIHEFGLYFENEWYRFVPREGTYNDDDPIDVLDITILQNNLLNPVLGIKDQRTDKRIDFVGGIRGLKELEKRVNSGEMKIAIALFPVSIQQLINIADSGNVMPPKSTWFEPKLRSGLVVHLF